MTKTSVLLLALLSTVAYGIWAVLAQVASRKLSPELTVVISCSFAAVTIATYIWYSGEGVIESVTHEDAGCWNCVYERQHPARAIVRTHRIAAVAFSIVLVLAVISMASMLTAALLALLVGGCVGTTLPMSQPSLFKIPSPIG